MKISDQVTTNEPASQSGADTMAVRNAEKAGATSLARMAGLISVATALILLIPSLSSAASNFNISLNGDSDTQMGAALKMIFVLTLITLGPTVLLTMTSFVRIVVVFSLLKTALGTQTTPPQQVLMGLALFLTVAIMWPVGQDIYTRGVGPYMEGEIEAKEALYQTITPLRKFMLKQTREADLMLFYEINKEARPDKPSDVEMHLLIPAFVISELRTAFEMGFLVFIPFLLLDMV
ncbi:MAG: flagellar type III secretion system pore protein FliP, partial [Deltaproteobacteria bacterium]|nr:flagellar type III secretion system pore protein FliP [Deltaproteobacteria bacterium]